jgi:hypothetical protein
MLCIPTFGKYCLKHYTALPNGIPKIITIVTKIWSTKFCRRLWWTTYKGHFTHEPRAMTMKLWEPKRNCAKVVPTHLQNHVVWSWILKCSMEPYVTRLSTECYFNEFLVTQVLTHDKIEQINHYEYRYLEWVPWSLIFVLGLPPRGDFGK